MNHVTIEAIKEQITSIIGVPSQFQTLVLCGKVVKSNYDLLHVPTNNNNEIHHIYLLVDPKFQSYQPPPKFRCPIGGTLINIPIVANTGRSYSKEYLNAWLEGIQQVYCPFKKLSRMNSTNRIDEVLNGESKTFLSRLTAENMEITTFNSLGELFSVLEPVKQTVSTLQSSSSESQTSSFTTTPSINTLLHRQHQQQHQQHHHQSQYPQSPQAYLASWGLQFIPAIVTVGDEKSGKSTLLQRLTMLPFFPKAINLCTTVVTIIKFRRGPSKCPTLRKFRNGIEVEDKPIRLAAAIADAKIQEELPEHLTSDLHFEIEIQHPFAPNLDVYDFPGFTSVGDDKPILSMFDKHVRENNHRSIYLYTINSMNLNENPQNAARARMTQLFEKYPEMMNQTLVVFTQADRASKERLQHLYKGLTSDSKITGHDLRWGHVVTAAHVDGFGLRVVKEGEPEDDEADRFLCVEQRARDELEFFKNNPVEGYNELNANEPAGGCKKLISTLQDIQIELLSDYLEYSTNKLKARRSELDQELVELGLPAAHIHQSEECRTQIRHQFISESKKELLEKWSEIENKFETEHLKKIEDELTNKLQSRPFKTRSEANQSLDILIPKLYPVFEAYFERDCNFWGKEISRVLLETSSDFNMKRFGKEIDLIAEHIKRRVSNHLKTETRKELNTFIAGLKHACLVQIVLRNGMFVVDFDQRVVYTLVNIFSAGMLLIFQKSDEIFSESNFETILKDAKFIEETRDERYAKLQEKILLDEALRGLPKMEVDEEYGENEEVKGVTRSEQQNDDRRVETGVTTTTTTTTTIPTTTLTRARSQEGETKDEN